MTTTHREQIVDRLLSLLKDKRPSPFNYERNLIIDKAPYLDAFVEGEFFPPFEVEIQMSSRCNLKCRWCIGEAVQRQRRVRHLADNIRIDNVDAIVDGLIDFKVNGLGIEIVKFSGFIGEPLIVKGATLKAIRNLVGGGFKVGLFTNGVYMSEDTWDTLSNIDYVHVSLDAGPSSYFWLKESPNASYTNDTFYEVIENIKGLNETRKRKRDRSHLKINVGFVVVPGNHEEIRSTTKLAKEAGADSIRFKTDIGGKHDLKTAGISERVFEDIEGLKNEFDSPQGFGVYSIHSKEDVESRAYEAWQCKHGCWYQQFFATIGSDGNLYLCDHNTMPGAPALGNTIVQSFREIWESDQRRYLINGIPYLCQSTVCPPFGNRANVLLKEIDSLTKDYGIPDMMKALESLRSDYDILVEETS